MVDKRDSLISSIFILGRNLRKFDGRDSFHKSSLSMLQIHTLLFIKLKSSPTMSEVAQQFGVALPTATKLVERMVNANLIKRISDNKDRRVIRMSLTRNGEKALVQMKEKRNTHLKKLFSLLPDTDIDHLQRIINELLLKLGEAHV